MKNKFLVFLSVILIFVFGISLNAKAVVTNKYDMQNSVEKLNQLADFDFISLINKSELIGYRLNNFEMLSGEYKRTVIATKDNIVQNINKIDIIENSTDFSDSEKEMQSKQIYNSTDFLLADLNTKTITYLMSLARFMPSITYQRYMKKFQDYYNELNITDNDLILK